MGFSRRRNLVTLVVLLIFISCATLRLQRPIKIDDEDWTLFGGNPERTNQSSFVVTPPLELVWEYDASAGFGSGSPLAVDSFVFVGTLQGEIHVVHIRTGKRAGVFGVESAIVGAPLIDGISVIAGSATGDRTLVSYDYRNGLLRWGKELGGIESSPLRFGHRLLVTTLDGFLYCLDKADGQELWRFETKKPVRSSPATDGSSVVFGSDEGYLYAVELESGRLAWRFKAEGGIYATPSIHRELVFFGSMDKNFYAVHLKDGRLAWKYPAGGRIYGGSTFYEDLVFFGSTDGILYALRLLDGSLVWRFQAGSIINSSPVVSGDIVYVGSLDKYLYALDASTSELRWKFDVKGRIKTSPLVWRNYVIVAAEDRSLFAFRMP